MTSVYLSDDGRQMLATLQNLDSPDDLNAGIDANIDIVGRAMNLVMEYCNELDASELKEKADKYLSLLIDLKWVQRCFACLRAEKGDVS